ncbi:MAG: ribosome silencing factor [Candidatus Latescibacterota bacterium]|nr:MAG: ribosome silencing factor [Candidatus Latescibacterota bacterium]
MSTTSRTAKLIAEFMLSKKAEEVVILDLRDLTDIAEYFVLCSGQTDLHVRAIVDAILEGMEAEGVRPWYVEGYEDARWVVLDFVDVVVHIFQPEVRAFYNLERLWGDAPREELKEEP